MPITRADLGSATLGVMLTARSVLAATEEHVNELPAEPIVLGGGAFLILVVLLLITLQFNRDR